MKPLCVNEAKGRPVKWQCGSVKMKADCGGELQDEAAYLDGRMRVKLARNEFVGAVRIIHHIQWLYRWRQYRYMLYKYQHYPHHRVGDSVVQATKHIRFKLRVLIRVLGKVSPAQRDSDKIFCSSGASRFEPSISYHGHTLS
jgi:hypothetical protein